MQLGIIFNLQFKVQRTPGFARFGSNNVLMLSCVNVKQLLNDFKKSVTLRIEAIYLHFIVNRDLLCCDVRGFNDL